MKKVFTFLLAVVCVVCGNAANDKVKSASVDLSKGNFSLHHDYLVSGPAALVKSVNDFIKADMVTAGLTAHEDDKTSVKEQFRTLTIPQTAQRCYEIFKRDIDADLETHTSEYGNTEISSECKLTTVRPKYLLLDCSTNGMFAGAAHGWAFVYAVTFDCKTGKILENKDIFKMKMKKALLKLIDKELRRQYYQGEAPGYAESLGTLDMPRFAPHPTAKGLTFIYQQYEIDCYAAGMPECTIPWAKVKPYLTPYYINLILK